MRSSVRFLIALFFLGTAACGSPTSETLGADAGMTPMVPMPDGGAPTDAASSDSGSAYHDAGSSGACQSTTTVSFAHDVAPILAPCGFIECHGGWRNRYIQNWVDITAPECTDGRKYVAPGDPDHSYVVDKVLGRNLCSGDRMPRGGMLNQTQIDKIISWVCAGAQNN